ncbi:MAG: hypothetical protein KDA84_07900 [Planctomycetaceae bacterium]|nr:hypothetical protein [Planctomycetaceae bacterium]
MAPFVASFCRSEPEQQAPTFVEGLSTDRIYRLRSDDNLSCISGLGECPATKPKRRSKDERNVIVGSLAQPREASDTSLKRIPHVSPRHGLVATARLQKNSSGEGMESSIWVSNRAHSTTLNTPAKSLSGE